MSYPAEAFIFETIGDGTLVDAGAIVEGVDCGRATGLGRRFVAKTWTHFIGVRLLVGRIISHPSPGQVSPDGWIGFTASPANLRPLTPAAEAMLALVTP